MGRRSRLVVHAGESNRLRLAENRKGAAVGARHPVNNPLSLDEGDRSECDNKLDAELGSLEVVKVQWLAWIGDRTAINLRLEGHIKCDLLRRLPQQCGSDVKRATDLMRKRVIIRQAQVTCLGAHEEIWKSLICQRGRDQ